MWHGTANLPDIMQGMYVTEDATLLRGVIFVSLYTGGCGLGVKERKIPSRNVFLRVGSTESKQPEAMSTRCRAGVRASLGQGFGELRHWLTLMTSMTPADDVGDAGG